MALLGQTRGPEGAEGFGQEGRDCPGLSSWSHRDQGATVRWRGAGVPSPSPGRGSSSQPRPTKGKSLPNVGSQQPAQLADARPWVAGALPPALPKPPGWRGQELCAPWPSGSASKGAPWGPGGRCVETGDASFLLLEALSLEAQCWLLLSVCLCLQPASPLGVGPVTPPSGAQQP